MSKYRYFVFDFDLTLADSSEGILECFKHVLKEFGYPPKDDRTIYNTIGMTPVDAFDLLICPTILSVRICARRM